MDEINHMWAMSATVGFSVPTTTTPKERNASNGVRDEKGTRYCHILFLGLSQKSFTKFTQGSWPYSLSPNASA